MYKNRLILLSLIICFLSFSAFSSSVLSQVQTSDHTSGFSLGIYPPISYVVIQPGRTTSLEFNLTNYGDPMIFTYQIIPFTVRDNIGRIKLVNCQEIHLLICDSPSWFSPEDAQDTFFIKKNESKKINFRLFIPTKTQSGDYSLTILISPVAKPSTGKVISQTIPTLGANIIITVTSEGKLDKEGKVVAFSPVGAITINFFSKRIQLFDSFDVIPIFLQMHNSGKTVIEPTGEVYVDSFLWPRMRFPILPQFILAKSTRTLLVGKDVGNQNKETNYSLILPRSFYLGRYQLTASLQVAPQSENKILLASSFWAFPFKLVAFATLVSILILWFNSRARGKRK